jgi:predicted transcriptional regulator
MSHEHFSSQTNKNRRDRIVLFSAILSCADKGINKTELMYKVGLSSVQLDKYIPVLVGCGLLIVFNGGKRVIYVTTEKGRRFVDKYGILIKLLELGIKDDRAWIQNTNAVLASHLPRRAEPNMSNHSMI